MAKGKMNAVVSLTLILTMMMSTLPVTAQERTEAPAPFDLRGMAPTTGPFARAAIREALQLAAAGAPPSASLEAVEQGGTPAAAGWSRVRQLAPGTDIIVTVTGAPLIHGQFLSADDTELTVNEAGRLQPIARNNVAEIGVSVKSDRLKTANRGAKWGFLIGAAAGVVTGVVNSIQYCKNHSCDTEKFLMPLGYGVLGGAIGAGVGALVGLGQNKTQTVIYRAP